MAARKLITSSSNSISLPQIRVTISHLRRQGEGGREREGERGRGGRQAGRQAGRLAGWQAVAVA
eukprot:8814863-Karenia_brevis.AAC.1